MNISKNLPKSTVLVVDDEKYIRMLLKDILTTLNYQPQLAANSKEAIGILKSKPVDIVITDLRLPNDSGLNLLQWMKEYKPRVPAIVVTGQPCVQTAVDCMKMGAYDYIRKPFDSAEVETALNNLLTVIKSDKLSSWNRTNVVNNAALFGGYQVIDIIGEGTMGIVFLAEKRVDDVMQRRALKVIKNSYLSGQDTIRYRRRFLHEAKAASRLRHPNVVNVIDYGLVDDEQTPYIIMEYFEGVTLKQIIQDQLKYDLKTKLKIICQMASGLANIHEHMICHRDIKPDNILVNREITQVKIMDFGLARLPDSKLTISGNLLGTPNYLAPEGFISPKMDHRADIFSLGIVAYELFVGERPFAAGNLPMLAYKISTNPPIEPRKSVDRFPRALQVILAKMLKKNADDRYQSAREIINDLDDFLATGEVRINGIDESDWA